MATPSGARFRLNLAGVGELLLSPGMESGMLRIGEAIKAEGEAIAPTGTPPDDPHPGEYKRSFVVTTEVRRSGRRYPSRRVVAYVRNVAPHAAAVEYGNTTGRGGAHHTLLRAAQRGGRPR